MGKVFNIVLVENSPLYREGIKLALNRVYNRFQFMDLSTLDALQLLLSFEEGGIDLVLIDIGAINSTGYAAVKPLIERSGIPVMMTCHEVLPEYQNFICSSGLNGVIEKSASVDEFNKAVIALLTGRDWLPELMHDEASFVHQRISLLTRRESEIFELLTEGMMNKQIAYKVGITEHTVKSHVSRILNKLGMNSRNDLVVSIHQERARIRMDDCFSC